MRLVDEHVDEARFPMVKVADDGDIAYRLLMVRQVEHEAAWSAGIPSAPRSGQCKKKVLQELGWWGPQAEEAGTEQAHFLSYVVTGRSFSSMRNLRVLMGSTMG